MVLGRTVFLMHLSNLSKILSALRDIVVKLVPECCCCNFWSGELRERVEKETMEKNCDRPYDGETDCMYKTGYIEHDCRRLR